MLASGTFGQLFSTSVNGQVYAQPVVAGNTVIVATENDWLYGLNAATGAIDWSRQLGTPWPSSAEGCSDLAPNVGVTGTPVYNPATSTVYLVSQQVPAGNSVYNPEFFMHAINVQTGAERPGWPVPIHGAPSQRPGPAVQPVHRTAAARAAAARRFGVRGIRLTLRLHPVRRVRGRCQHQQPGADPVERRSRADRRRGRHLAERRRADVRWAWPDLPGHRERRVPATGPGHQPAAGTRRLRWSGSACRATGRSRRRTSSARPTRRAWTPPTPTSAPAARSGCRSAATAYPHLQVQAGKDGRVFLLNDDDLGGREQGPGDTDDDVSQSGPYGGQWGHPAAFGDTPALTASNAASAGDYVYYLGANDYLRVLKLGLNSAGRPALSDVANSAATFGYTSGSPVVTSNGANLASAVVWVVGAAGGNGARGTLEAFDAVPPAGCSTTKPCTISPIWSAPIGTASKFAIPATDAGRVYVGTRDGTVLGFGSPS